VDLDTPEEHTCACGTVQAGLLDQRGQTKKGAADFHATPFLLLTFYEQLSAINHRLSAEC